MENRSVVYSEIMSIHVITFISLQYRKRLIYEIKTKINRNSVEILAKRSC